MSVTGLQVSNVKRIFLVTLVIIIYMLLSFFRFSGLMAYIIPLICWSFLASITLYVYRLEKMPLWFSKQLIFMAALVGVFQIVVLVFTGFFTGFGRSPYAFTPIGITINLAYFSSTLLGLELSRAYFIKSYRKRKIIMGLGLIALFYTIVIISPKRFTSLGNPADTAKFLGSEFLPTLAQSLLATYLALLGGPAASIAYLGTLQAFEWLSPILPNPTWAIKALLNTLTPTIGFLTVNQTVSPFTLMRLGIMSRSEVVGRIRIPKKSSPLTWTAIAIIAFILVWGSTGLLGFQPNIIASGSMRPTLEVGDIAITVQTSPNNIKVGDIIQYWREGEPGPTIHRVTEIYRSGSTTHITTKGDANNAPDDPITPTQTVNKLIFTIPKLGWISINLKTIIGKIWSFFLANTTLAYATLAVITLTGSIYAIHAHKSRSAKKWRSPHRKRGWPRT